MSLVPVNVYVLTGNLRDWIWYLFRLVPFYGSALLRLKNFRDATHMPCNIRHRYPVLSFCLKDMIKYPQQFDRFYTHAIFFEEFSTYCMLQIFTEVHSAPGEFPSSHLVTRPRTSPGEKYSLITIEHHGPDSDTNIIYARPQAIFRAIAIFIHIIFGIIRFVP